MVGRIAIILSLLVFAGGVLFVSVFRTVAPDYAFSQAPYRNVKTPIVDEPVEYYLVYPGVLPDHFLWPLKVARDQIWLFLTTDPLKRSELLLLFADKRLGAAKALLEGGKTGLAVTSAQKAEQYLEQSVEQEMEARSKGKDTGGLLDRLSIATLKHREILEEMYAKAPDEARPRIAESINLPKKLFDSTKESLRSLSRPIPKSPFEP